MCVCDDVVDTEKLDTRKRLFMDKELMSEFINFHYAMAYVL